MSKTTEFGKHLLRLEEKLLSPETRKSSDEVMALLSENFIEIGSSGRIYEKQDVLDALKVEKPTQFSLADFKAIPLADGVVLVTYRSTMEREDGKAGSSSLHSSIWKKGQGGWKLVFHQGTPLR